MYCERVCACLAQIKCVCALGQQPLEAEQTQTFLITDVFDLGWTRSASKDPFKSRHHCHENRGCPTGHCSRTRTYVVWGLQEAFPVKDIKTHKICYVLWPSPLQSARNRALAFRTTVASTHLCAPNTDWRKPERIWPQHQHKAKYVTTERGWPPTKLWHKLGIDIQSTYSECMRCGTSDENMKRRMKDSWNMLLVKQTRGCNKIQNGKWKWNEQPNTPHLHAAHKTH